MSEAKEYLGILRHQYLFFAFFLLLAFEASTFSVVSVRCTLNSLFTLNTTKSLGAMHLLKRIQVRSSDTFVEILVRFSN
jgi:hypothetical protein